MRQDLRGNETMEPYFSVIVPVYNVEVYLARCIDSLLAQTFSDYEIILVDDGSTDASGAICDCYADRFPQVTALHKRNGGLASARNAGLKRAAGTYISFVDSDDWLEREALQVIHDCIHGCAPDIVNFGYQKIRNGIVQIREHAIFPEGYYDASGVRECILPDSVAREKAFAQVNLPVQMSACMCVYRCSFLRGHQLWFESERRILCEDWLFNLCCLCRAQSMVILHEILYNYDTREESLSMSYKTDTYERRKCLYTRYREELASTGALNQQIQHRLQNFWMESIYYCCIVELNAPAWNRTIRQRVETLCRDPDFLAYSKGLHAGNCTLKGLIFRAIVRFRLHSFFRVVYRFVKKRKIIG